MRYVILSLYGFVTVLLLLSCAVEQTSTDPIGPSLQSDISYQVSQSSGIRLCWGIWDVFIDPQTESVEIVPLRGVDFMVNVVNFLQPPIAPIQLLTIQIDTGQSDLPQGLVVCDVTIQHPFPGTKFGGFDVMGIVLDDWPGHPAPADPAIIASMPPLTLLQNPDGWTRWWNQVEFTSFGTLLGYTEGALANHNWTCHHTLNAFKYFCDDLEADDPFDPDPAARGFFSSEDPGINSRRYVLQFPVNGNPVFHYKYAINASWAAPNPGAVAPYTADDFPPEANMAEAYKIKILNNSSTAYYENESSFGGYISLVVEVRDWQFDGDLGNVTNEVKEITIASPTLFPVSAVLDLTQAYLIPGNTTAFRVPVLIDGVSPISTENQYIFIRVKSANVTTYEPQFPESGSYDYPDGSLAAYGILEVPILDGVTESTWPTFRRFYDRTGRTDVVGPSTDNVLLEWTEPNGQLFFGGIAVDSKGRAICHSNNLYCLDLSGEVVWSAYIQDNSYMTPTVGPGDGVYIATNPSSETCRLGHFDCNGEYVWSHDYNYGIMDCGPVFQDNATILISTWGGVLAKVNIMGNVIWDFETDGLSIAQGPAVGDDGTIYVSTHNDRVYAVSQGGEKLWMTQCGYSDMCATPALGPDGIFVGSMSGKMYCLNYNNGSVKWSTDVTGGCHSSVAVGDDGYIYFGTRKNWVYCLDQDSGNIKWDYKTSGEIFTTTGVLDGAGHLYIGNVAGDFYCLNTSNGDVIWVYNTGPYEIRCMSPAITDDGAVLVGTLGGKFFAFKDE